MDMFGGLGLHVSEDATTKQQGSGTPDTAYEYEVRLFRALNTCVNS